MLADGACETASSAARWPLPARWGDAPAAGAGAASDELLWLVLWGALRQDDWVWRSDGGCRCEPILWRMEPRLRDRRSEPRLRERRGEAAESDARLLRGGLAGSEGEGRDVRADGWAAGVAAEGLSAAASAEGSDGEGRERDRERRRRARMASSMGSRWWWGPGPREGGWGIHATSWRRGSRRALERVAAVDGGGKAPGSAAGCRPERGGAGRRCMRQPGCAARRALPCAGHARMHACMRRACGARGQPPCMQALGCSGPRLRHARCVAVAGAVAGAGAGARADVLTRRRQRSCAPAAAVRVRRPRRAAAVPAVVPA